MARGLCSSKLGQNLSELIVGMRISRPVRFICLAGFHDSSNIIEESTFG